MPRKNRGYKRGEPFRDAILFVIACEGAVREKEYFELLATRSSQIKITVLENKGGNSAPKWVLDSAANFVEQKELRDDDQLWFVMDVDLWPADQLRTIHEECEKRNNWHMALSNPCFEVWLYMHFDDIQNSTSTSARELKAEINSKVRGGYNKKVFIPAIREAHRRSLALDAVNHFMPEFMRTKLHLLTTEIFTIIGNNTGI